MTENAHKLRAFPPIDELLAHTGDMLLLDRILSFENDSTLAEYSPQTHAWYADESGHMPAWIGIELMAQTVAAHVGLLKRDQNAKPKQGVLLGTRSFRAAVAYFGAGVPLQIQATIAYRDDSGLGAYDCMIMSGDMKLASATLKVFEPENFESFLQGTPA